MKTGDAKSKNMKKVKRIIMKLIDIQTFIIEEFVCYNRFMLTSDKRDM